MSLALGGPILALDSSTSTGSAAVGDATGVMAESVVNVTGGLSSALLPAVNQVMRAAGLRPADLAGVAVGSGPGSFTGLRVAAATVKGMLQALDLPLFAYSGLLAAAAGAWGAPGPVCALFDARRRDVYAACYRIGKREEGRGKSRDQGDGGRTTDDRRPAGQGGAGRAGEVEVLMPPTALSLDELLDRLSAEPPALFVGEGAVLHGEEIERRLGVPVSPPHFGVPRASALIWLATRAPELGRVPAPADWEPDYVRAAGAERIAAARRQGAAP
jgi:tRNA threonylcarbamoyladenosine biosynthesis protein TsaB